MATRSNFTANPLLREIEVGDQVLLFDPVKDVYHALNLAGKLIWIEAKRSSAESAYSETIATFFGGKASDYSTDVASAIEAYLANEILVRVDKDTPRLPLTGDTQLHPQTPPPAYEAPTLRTYSTDWMKKNHPSAFLSVKFSDTWSPGSQT